MQKQIQNYRPSMADKKVVDLQKYKIEKQLMVASVAMMSMLGANTVTSVYANKTDRSQSQVVTVSKDPASRSIAHNLKGSSETVNRPVKPHGSRVAPKIKTPVYDTDAKIQGQSHPKASMVVAFDRDGEVLGTMMGNLDKGTYTIAIKPQKAGDRIQVRQIVDCQMSPAEFVFVKPH